MDGSENILAMFEGQVSAKNAASLYTNIFFTSTSFPSLFPRKITKEKIDLGTRMFLRGLCLREKKIKARSIFRDD